MVVVPSGNRLSSLPPCKIVGVAVTHRSWRGSAVVVGAPFTWSRWRPAAAATHCVCYVLTGCRCLAAASAPRFIALLNGQFKDSQGRAVSVRAPHVHLCRGNFGGDRGPRCSPTPPPPPPCTRPSRRQTKTENMKDKCKSH
ncbi:hypothetical protein O3P69_003883 [Scylla paramamosain]|uniref:Uncharacterized protein n=2 Tax=Scylla paramamosain TaxID=85552 RepID=A0AAW0UH58_SCYPA